jgi:nucleoside-diphosphate-sugar epimerase
MKEIVVGAGGFLGSTLRKHLKGKDVVILPVEMLMDTAGMHEFLKANEPYHLYYLAAYGNLHGQGEIQEMYRAIIIKFLNLLEATLNTKCEAILTAGTTSEYGNKTKPMTETDLLNPVTFYGAAKAGATHLATVWARQYNSPVVIFRPASMTGVGEQPIHLIPTLIRSCMFKEIMPFESGYYHDYINVKDVARALELLANCAKEHKGEIFNVGSGKQTSNLQLKEMIEQITGEKAKINKAVKINPQNVSEVWIADSSKLNKLGWKPQITLIENLKDMVKAV